MMIWLTCVAYFTCFNLQQERPSTGDLGETHVSERENMQDYGSAKASIIRLAYGRTRKETGEEDPRFRPKFPTLLKN